MSDRDLSGRLPRPRIALERRPLSNSASTASCNIRFSLRRITSGARCRISFCSRRELPLVVEGQQPGRDLHRCEVQSVPHSLERAVGEPEPEAERGVLKTERRKDGKTERGRGGKAVGMTPFRFSVFVALGIAACGGGSVSSPPPSTPPAERPSLAQTYRPSGHMAAGDVFVHLFEWKWTDIAAECETVLGPAGFKAVQVSPPEEHSITPSHDWSERYQPVSYSVARSRSGTGTEFGSMVTRCKAAGVDIIVDAVINHMTNFPSPGVGSNGTAYTKYSYPGLYTPSDFHPACSVNDYTSAANVQDCELF